MREWFFTSCSHQNEGTKSKESRGWYEISTVKQSSTNLDDGHTAAKPIVALKKFVKCNCYLKLRCHEMHFCGKLLHFSGNAFYANHNGCDVICTKIPKAFTNLKMLRNIGLTVWSFNFDKAQGMADEKVKCLWLIVSLIYFWTSLAITYSIVYAIYEQIVNFNEFKSYANTFGVWLGVSPASPVSPTRWDGRPANTWKLSVIFWHRLYIKWCSQFFGYSNLIFLIYQKFMRMTTYKSIADSQFYIKSNCFVFLQTSCFFSASS